MAPPDRKSEAMASAASAMMYVTRPDVWPQFRRHMAEAVQRELSDADRQRMAEDAMLLHGLSRQRPGE